MQKIVATSAEAQSVDLTAANIEQLKVLFPELITEGSSGVIVNVDVLKSLVGDKTATDADEKYGLNWHGKRQARTLALTPSTGTLRPCPDESVDWDTTQNVVIEGDNLEALKLLQKSYAGKVKLIYIDPPYNTGSDFVYPDDFRDNIKNYLEITGQLENARKISSNSEAGGRFHTDWLNMMYPRLKLARALLREDGVIFVSIDDTELANLQCLLSEIFGEENFQANISWQKRYTRSNNTVDFTTVVEHILVYSRSESFSVNLLDRTKDADARYTNPDKDPRGPWKGASILNPATPQQRPNLCYPIKNPNTGQVTNPSTNAWRRSRSEFERLQSEGRLYWGIDGKQPLPAIKMFLSDARDITPINLWEHTYAGNTDDGTRDLKKILGEKVFDNPKPVQLINRVIEHGSDKDSIILDFFAGSGTTGQAVLSQNAIDGGTRRYILVQVPEPLDQGDKLQKAAADYCAQIHRPLSIAEITKERLRRVGKKIQDENPIFGGDLGFRAFKLGATNIRAWSPDRTDLVKTLLDHEENIQAGRTQRDVLYELILKRGLDLCVPMEVRKIASKDVYAVGGGVLIACLSEEISSEDVEQLARGIVQWHQELSPVGEATCIFRDGAFSDDVVKVNMAAILEQSGMANVHSL
ncbi:adenine-specific DNA-methyltransferase [Pseudoxanthomonas sp. GM95]|uniref:site-specific DNA-methyltransferase n=1 Tax=Pseudoxanthomonas sp. GM95 TaxID=1881043 RepID=UPI0008D77E94|nr:site-specific DNA-methyltransferase [Pseudoxanthomonas sp. GM95]SEM57715.1 adenine-specific DNA-methyltransferase [Pseudoxanthomonas sp. GM95]